MAPGKLVPVVRVSMLGERAELSGQGEPLDVVPLPLHWLVHWLPGDPWPEGLRKEGAQTMQVATTMELTTHAGEKAVVVRAAEIPVEILPAAEASVVLGRAKEGMAAEMESAVKLRVAAGSGEGISPVPQMPLGTLWIGAPPMPASFRVMLRQGKREWLLARVLVRTNDAQSVPLTFPATAGLLEAGDAQVVCVPELEGAVGTVEVLEIWPTEVVRPIRIGRGAGAGN
jgi:hypothetical protein